MKFSEIKDKAVDLADDLPRTVKTATRGVTAFLKKHKKLAITLLVIYLVFKYLFDEEESRE